VGAQASPRVLGAPSVRLSLCANNEGFLKRNLRRSGQQCRTDHHVSVMVWRRRPEKCPAAHLAGLVSNSDKTDFLGNQEADGQSEKATLLQISRKK